MTLDSGTTIVAPPSTCVKASVIIKAVEDRVSQGSNNPKLPFVTLTFAQSIDGSIAAKAGQQMYLSNKHSQTMTHKLRAIHDGIMVGISTVITDDPQLSVRLVDGETPTAIVLDSKLRIPITSRLLQHAGKAPIIVCTDRADRQKLHALEAAGAKVLSLPEQPNGRVNLVEMLTELKNMGIEKVMVEGGACVITSFLHSKLANQLVLTICPVFVGGMPCFNGKNTSCASLPKLVNMNTEVLSGDLVVRGDLDWISTH
jgi:GTP cyclohydrolase II